MRSRIGKRYSAEVHQQACEWFVEFRAGQADEDVRHAFHAWLQQAPAHMAAYLDVAASWNRSAGWNLEERFSKAALIAEATDSDNVLPYPGGAGADTSRPSAQRRPRFVSASSLAAAAGVLGLIAAGLLAIWLRSDRTVYSTGTGQKRVITLADGSVIDLNARSRIIVHYTKTSREIDLVRGQALFADTYEPNRPFIVRSGATVVRAIGTQFDVNLLQAETIVTVIEGKVVVARQQPTMASTRARRRPVPPRATADVATVYLTAGQQITVSPTRELRPVRANTTDAIAWVDHKLIFASTELRNVVQEFNRYNVRRMVIASPSLETFRIDGVFSSTNPASLIAFLSQYPGIQVTDAGSTVVISRRPRR